MNLNILDTHTHLYNPHRKTNKFTPLNVPFTDFAMLDNITISDNYFQNEKVASLKADYLGNCFSTHFINLFSAFEYNNFTPFDVYKHTGDEFNNVQLFLFYLMKHDLIRCDEESLRIVVIDVLTIKNGGELPADPPANNATKIKFLEDTLLYLEQKAGTGESLVETSALYNAVKSMLDGVKQGFTHEVAITILALTNESDSEAINAVIGDFTTLKQAVVDGKIIKIGGIVVSNAKYSEAENAVSLVFNDGLSTKSITIKDTGGVLSAAVSEESLPDNIATQEYVDEKLAALGSVFTFKGTVASKDDLPVADNKTGDLYLVGTDADNMAEYIWAEDKWEELGTRQEVDLSALATKEELSAEAEILQGKLTDGLALKADKADTYTKAEVDGLIANVDVDTTDLATKAELATKQDILTAGANITITDNVIAATVPDVDTSALATKTELTAGLAGKQDTLTAGNNITITGNTISANIIWKLSLQFRGNIENVATVPATTWTTAKFIYMAGSSNIINAAGELVMPETGYYIITVQGGGGDGYYNNVQAAIDINNVRAFRNSNGNIGNAATSPPTITAVTWLSKNDKLTYRLYSPTQLKNIDAQGLYRWRLVYLGN